MAKVTQSISGRMDLVNISAVMIFVHRFPPSTQHRQAGSRWWESGGGVVVHGGEGRGVL